MVSEIKSNGTVVGFNLFEAPNMSDELLEKIFFSLNSVQDVVSLGLTDKKLQQICLDNHIWKSLLIKHFPHSFKINQLNIAELDLYKKLTTIQRNIKNGTYTINTLNCPSVSLPYKVHGNRFFYNCSFYQAQMRADVIQVYDLVTQKQLPWLETKLQNLFFCLQVHGDRLFSGGSYSNELSNESCMIAIWDLKTLKLEDIFHTDYAGTIKYLCVQGDELFAGVGNRVVIWNLKTKAKLREIDCLHSVLSIRLKENSLFVQVQNMGLLSGAVYRYDLNNPNPEKNPIHYHNTEKFEIFENLLVFFHEAYLEPGWKQFTIMDIETREIIKTFNTQHDFFDIRQNLFQMQNGCFFAKQNGKIHVLDFKGPSNQ